VVIPDEDSEPIRYWYNGVSYIDIEYVWQDKENYSQAILKINDDLTVNLILCNNPTFSQETS